MYATYNRQRERRHCCILLRQWLTVYPLSNKNSAKYEPSWPVIPVMRATRFSYDLVMMSVKWKCYLYIWLMYVWSVVVSCGNKIWNTEEKTVRINCVKCQRWKCTEVKVLVIFLCAEMTRDWKSSTLRNSVLTTHHRLRVINPHHGPFRLLYLLCFKTTSSNFHRYYIHCCEEQWM